MISMITWSRSQSRASPNGRVWPAGTAVPKCASPSVCKDLTGEPGANGKSTPKPAEERTLRATVRMSWMTIRARGVGVVHAVSKHVACEMVVFHTAESIAPEKGGEVILRC